MIHNPPPPLPPPRQPLQSNSWPWCFDAPCRRPPLSLCAVNPSVSQTQFSGYDSAAWCVLWCVSVLPRQQLWHHARQCTVLLQMSTRRASTLHYVNRHIYMNALLQAQGGEVREVVSKCVPTQKSATHSETASPTSPTSTNIKACWTTSDKAVPDSGPSPAPPLS